MEWKRQWIWLYKNLYNKINRSLKHLAWSSILTAVSWNKDIKLAKLVTSVVKIIENKWIIKF